MITDWIILNSLDQLDTIVDESFKQEVLIFKHSTSCGISHHVSQNIIDEWEDLKAIEPKFYYLDLLAYRSVSNQVAQKFNVIHQSPQVIVIKNGKAVYSASHFGIIPSNLLDQLQ